MLSLHRPTSNSSSTVNFPWLSHTENWLTRSAECLQDNSSARTPRKTPSSFVKNACLQFRCLAIDVLFHTTQKTQFLLYWCHVLKGGVYRPSHRNGSSSIVACIRRNENDYGHPCLDIETGHMSQYVRISRIPVQFPIFFCTGFKIPFSLCISGSQERIYKRVRVTSELLPPQQVLSSRRRTVNLKGTKSLYFPLRAFKMLNIHIICKVLYFVLIYRSSLYWYSWGKMIRTRKSIQYYFLCFKCLNAYMNSLCNSTLINCNDLKCITHFNLCSYHKIQLLIVLSVFYSLRSLICIDNRFFKVTAIYYQITS
jgi:hypothetical protein